MNYIYDILINFNEKLYNFYEWEINDEIIHIRKIPLFKIDSKSLVDIKNNKVRITDNLLVRLKEKTEIFTNKNIKNLDYTCILSDGCEVIGVEFNNDGVTVGKSKLLIDEESEVVEVCERVSESKICYEILMSEISDEFKTRRESEIDGYIINQIKRLDKDENIEKLKYLYYECFNEKEDNKEKIIKEINLELQKNWHNIAEKLYNFFKLTSINK